MNASGVKVVMATAWYPPYDIGGTEIYVEGLVDELSRLGAQCVVLAPRHGDAPARYEHRGVSVETYPVNAEPTRAELRDDAPHDGFDCFRQMLMRHSGALYHQHAWTRGCGLNHLRAARELAFRTALSVHVASPICLRGTMLRFGVEPCDGRIDGATCGACWAQERGAPGVVSRAVGLLPPPVARGARQFDGRLATMLGARSLAADKARALGEAFESSDRVIAVCQWLFDALALNGAPKEKLALSRHGLGADYLGSARAVAGSRRTPDGLLKLVYLGRWDRVKGIDIVVAAVRAIPSSLPIQLTIHAIAPASDPIYEAEVRALIDGDPRIIIATALDRAHLASALAAHDVLVAPSQCFETGPIVVLEAIAAGLFVLGSRLGGIAELVDEADGGELVEASDVAEWSQAIARLAARRKAGPLARSRRRVRDQSEVAEDMLALYRAM